MVVIDVIVYTICIEAKKCFRNIFVYKLRRIVWNSHQSLFSASCAKLYLLEIFRRFFLVCKMKVIIALAVLVAVAAARPDAADPSATILRYDNSQPGPEGFNWR